MYVLKLLGVCTHHSTKFRTINYKLLIVFIFMLLFAGPKSSAKSPATIELALYCWSWFKASPVSPEQYRAQTKIVATSSVYRRTRWGFWNLGWFYPDMPRWIEALYRENHGWSNPDLPTRCQRFYRDNLSSLISNLSFTLCLCTFEILEDFIPIYFPEGNAFYRDAPLNLKVTKGVQ